MGPGALKAERRTVASFDKGGNTRADTSISVQFSDQWSVNVETISSLARAVLLHLDLRCRNRPHPQICHEVLDLWAPSISAVLSECHVHRLSIDHRHPMAKILPGSLALRSLHSPPPKGSVKDTRLAAWHLERRRSSISGTFAQARSSSSMYLYR